MIIYIYIFLCYIQGEAIPRVQTGAAGHSASEAASYASVGAASSCTSCSSQDDTKYKRIKKKLKVYKKKDYKCMK